MYVMDEEEAAMCLADMMVEQLDKRTAEKLRQLIQDTDSLMFQKICSETRKNNAGERRNEKQNAIQKANENLNVIERRKEEQDAIQMVNENLNTCENGNRTVNMDFKPDPRFIKKLSQGEFNLVRLPPLKHAIDGIVLPNLPPIEALTGKIISCTEPFEKQLTESDVKVNQARFAFCGESLKLLREFMNVDEYRKVIGTLLPKGLEVTIYDQMGRAYEMVLILWGTRMHVLSRGWTNFCFQNQLKCHFDWVTVWMFRHSENQKLCFAVIPRRFPTPDLIGKPQKNGNKNKKQKGEEEG